MDNKAIAERDQSRDAPVQGALPWPIVVSVRAMLKLPKACQSRPAGLEADWVSARTTGDRQTSASTEAKSVSARRGLRVGGMGSMGALVVTIGLRSAWQPKFAIQVLSEVRTLVSKLGGRPGG